MNPNLQPHGRFISVAQNKAYKGTDLKKKKAMGTFHSAQGRITVGAQQVYGDKVSPTENQSSTHLIEITLSRLFILLLAYGQHLPISLSVNWKFKHTEG